MTRLTHLLDPIDHALSLRNRVVMAPMTRSRASADHVPTEIMATYYGERANAGLIITEGTAPSPNGVGYPRIPGLYNGAQADGWRNVTERVHRNGGRMVAQLMHTGRISHPDNMPDGAEVLAPSAIQASDTTMHVDGKGELPLPEPRAMTASDIGEVITEFVTAAERAVRAGFDGIELHAANGYLLEQFINPGTNQRDDQYGGSIENRCRLVLLIAEQVSQAIGNDRVGIRLSPNGQFNEVGPFDGQFETFDHLTRQLDRLSVAYIHLVDHESMGSTPLPEEIRTHIRKHFSGLLILSGGYTADHAERMIQHGHCDLVAFGRPYIANPDLIERWTLNAPLAEPRQELFYTPGPEGYIDYPTLADTARLEVS